MVLTFPAKLGLLDEFGEPAACSIMASASQPSKPTTVDFRGVIDWYQRHCDDSWEHQYGLKLETLDNPGWLLTIDLIHTDLQGRTMPEVREGLSPDDGPCSPNWIHCYVRDNQFRGAGDPNQVARLFQVFDQFRCNNSETSR